MNSIQTGIGVALAVVVVAIFFIVPGLSPFNIGQNGQTPTQTVTQGTDTSAASSTSSPQTATLSPINLSQLSQAIMDAQNNNKLEMSDVVVGTGQTAAAGDTVTVQYVGQFTNGTVFDASAAHPETANGFPFALGAGQVIKGWDMGVAGMKEGGKRILIIPASLAYGSQGAGSTIPPNATLVFQVELLKVQKPAAH